MQISEMYQLAIWVKTEIVEGKIIQNYSQLVNVLNANAKKQNNQQAQPFVDQKNTLIDSIAEINITTLSLSQIEIIKTAEIESNIGQKGIKNIEDILSNTLDIAHVATQITNMQNQIKQGIQKFNQVETSLLPFVDSSEQELLPEHVLTRVIFENDACVNNINELREWSSKWFDIGRGFAVANGQTPEDIKIIGGARGSLIIELALLATTALPIAKAINLTLDSMVKYKDFQLKAYDVRQLKEDNPRIAEELEEDAKRWESRAIDLKKEIAEDISVNIQDHFLDYKNENQAELNKAVKTLVDFISKGGDVDCVISDESEYSEEAEEMVETMRLLKDDFTKIRELKETLLIEHHHENQD